jgi:hypothetical protein
MSTTSTRCQDERSKDGREEGRHAQAEDSLRLEALCDSPLPFMGMISFWQVFDGLVPKMLTQTFGLSNWLTGVVMALDNIFGLILLPWFGILSDRCRSRLGRRTDPRYTAAKTIEPTAAGRAWGEGPPSSWPALQWRPSLCRSSPWRTTWAACRSSLR